MLTWPAMTVEAASRATERGGETRRHILEVAARLFAGKGYAGASFSDLIEASGLTKGAFYFHFPSKEALALAAFAHEQERWVEAVRGGADPDAPAVEQLAGMLRAACDFHQAEPSARCVGRLCLELGEDAALRPRLTPFLAVWEELVAAFLRKGQKEGDVRRDVDVEAVARLSVAAWIGMNELSWLMSGGRDLRRRAEEFHEFFTAAVRSTKKEVRRGG